MTNKIYIKPSFRKRGYSWGFDWPLQYGYLYDLKVWAVWQHETGLVIHWLPSVTNTHGYDFSESKARDLSAPKHDPAMNALLDMVS